MPKSGESLGEGENYRQIAGGSSLLAGVESVQASFPKIDPRMTSPAPLAKPLVIGHRGASGLAPENTLSAFKLALALGVDGVEFDVQLSADDLAVVIHDLQLDRTTRATGAVSKHTAEELASLDAGTWFYNRLKRRPRLRNEVETISESAGLSTSMHTLEPVPNLEQVLEILSLAHLKRVFIELKGRPGRTQRLLPIVIDQVRAFQLQRVVRVVSFDHRLIAGVRALDPSISTGALFSLTAPSAMSARSIIRTIERVEANEAALHFGLVTPRLVEALQGRGISVAVWTVNNKLMMRRLVSIGVDSIMTDYPDRLLQVTREPAVRRLRRIRLGAKRLRERLRSGR